MQTKDTLNVLQESADNRVIDEDIENAEDLMDKLAHQNYNINKLNEVITGDISELDEDDEDLIKQWMAEDEQNNVEEPNYVPEDPSYKHNENDGQYEQPVQESAEKEPAEYEEEKVVFA